MSVLKAGGGDLCGCRLAAWKELVTTCSLCIRRGRAEAASCLIQPKRKGHAMAAAALTNQTSLSSPLLFNNPHPNPNYSKSHLSILSKPSRPSFSLLATSHSSPAIFLPFLEHEKQEVEHLSTTQTQQDGDGDGANEEDKDGVEEGGEEEEEEDSVDPILRFFKSQTSTTHDPPRQGKFSLKKNRRSSWRLAPQFDSDTLNEESPQIVTSNYVSRLPDRVVGEILKLARELPKNMTLGEILGGYEGRVSAKESVEILALMGEEGLLMGCLYFYEWMGLQEPSLVTARACTILFPILGRAGMGDKLVIFLRNLPQQKEFLDVHVYNSAISGLLCCRRYVKCGSLVFVALAFSLIHVLLYMLI